jgi:hypothetical protein
MDNEWVALHLQTIRTLMERSALYRRALAPISIFVGVVGILAAAGGWCFKIETAVTFATYWMAVSLIAIAGALTLVRRQAVKHGENFWSPPTRRVAAAMAPALLIGLILGCFVRYPFALIIAWVLLYGLGLHAAGFFMPRGIRLFGLAFIALGFGLLALDMSPSFSWPLSPHWLMGIIFGISHLAYGVYLYFTEQRKNET